MQTENYPRTQLEAIRYFADPDKAHDFFVNMRCPHGVTCPHCKSNNVTFTKTKEEKPRRLWNCHECGKQFTAKVGTIFEDSPLGFDKWLPAVWLIVNAKNGVSSCELGRALGVQQRTAWFMLHRIRHSLGVGSIEKLSGTIEADETFIGGKAANMHASKRKAKIVGRGPTGKAIVMGLLQRGGPVRAKVVLNTKRHTLHTQIKAHVTPGSRVFTDALPSYNGLDSQYEHEAVDHAVEYARGNVHTNGMENFWCLLKRSIRGTYVHVNAGHVERYVDEQAYRFNERKGTDESRFVSAAKEATGKRITYQQLTA